MLRDDDEYDDWKYECPVCHRSFGSFGSLDDHMLQHSSPRQSPGVCNTSGFM